MPDAGGTANVIISGGQPGCTLAQAPQFVSGSAIPAGAPAGAIFPVGAFSLQAAGCGGDTLTIAITYSDPLPANVRLQKFGPPSAGAPAAWFPAPGASISSDRRTVTYTVADNGAGDNDAAAGQIADPFAPMVLPLASGDAHAVPTLSEWAVALLSLAMVVLGLRGVRRRI